MLITDLAVFFMLNIFRITREITGIFMCLFQYASEICFCFSNIELFEDLTIVCFLKFKV